MESNNVVLRLIVESLTKDPMVPRFGYTLNVTEETLSITFVDSQKSFKITPYDLWEE